MGNRTHLMKGKAAFDNIRLTKFRTRYPSNFGCLATAHAVRFAAISIACSVKFLAAFMSLVLSPRDPAYPNFSSRPQTSCKYVEMRAHCPSSRRVLWMVYRSSCAIHCAFDNSSLTLGAFPFASCSSSGRWKVEVSTTARRYSGSALSWYTTDAMREVSASASWCRTFGVGIRLAIS